MEGDDRSRKTDDSLDVRANNTTNSVHMHDLARWW